MNVLHASFDSDTKCQLAFGTRDGFRVLNIDHLDQNLFETSESGVGRIQLFRSNGTSMVAIVGSGDLAGSSPRKLKIFDVSTRKTVCELSFQSTILSCSINSKYIAVCLESKIHIIEVNGMKTIKRIVTPTNPLGIMAISKSINYSLLAYPSSSTVGKVTILNIDNIGILSSSSDITYDAHKSPLACLQLNVEGTFIATASITGTLIRVFDTRTGIKISEYRRGIHHALITSLLFCSFDPVLIVGSSTGTVHIFQLSDDEDLELSVPKLDASQEQSDPKPKNIFTNILRNAFTSVQIELRNSKSYSRACYIARIPSAEGPICMNVLNNENGDKTLFVVTPSGYLYR